jgi:hypothetical protein
VRSSRESSSSSAVPGKKIAICLLLLVKSTGYLAAASFSPYMNPPNESGR